MSKTIWKFPITVDLSPFGIVYNEQFTLDLPAGAEVLTVRFQKLVPTIWVRVNPEAPKCPRKFLMMGTGKPIPEGWEHTRCLGMFISPDEDLVFHLFERE